MPLPDAIAERLRQHRETREAERPRAAQLWVDEGWVFADELGRRINPRTD